jgi:hypothetical protein
MSRGNAAIMNLIATNNFENDIGLKSIAYEYETFDNINDYIGNSDTDITGIKIQRITDVVFPEYLEFTLNNSNYSTEEFITELKKSTLKLYLSSNCFEFPLNLLINLNKPTYCDNKVYIKTSFNIFFGDLPLIAVGIPEVFFTLNNYNNLSRFIERVGIICELIFLHTEERRALAINEFKRLYQELTWVEYDIRNIRNINNAYKFHIDFPRVSKGFFIECEEINNLSGIQLNFDIPGNNNNQRFYLNKFLIQTKCVKINENMIYFPFNSRKSYTDTSVQSYEGGTNFCRINDVTLLLKFNEPINNIKIYNLGSNLLKKTENRGTHVAYNNTFFNNGLRNYESQNYSFEYYYWGGKKQSLIQYIDPIIKQIGENITCAITCEDIGVGAKYLSCHQCNNNFSEVEIKKWIEKKKTCPTCRVGWDNFQIYINGSESAETNKEKIE